MQPRPHSKRSININVTPEEWELIQEQRKEHAFELLATTYVSKEQQRRNNLSKCLFRWLSGQVCGRPATREPFCGFHDLKAKRDKAHAERDKILVPNDLHVWYNPLHNWYWGTTKTGDLSEWSTDS